LGIGRWFIATVPKKGTIAALVIWSVAIATALSCRLYVLCWFWVGIGNFGMPLGPVSLYHEITIFIGLAHFFLVS